VERDREAVWLSEELMMRFMEQVEAEMKRQGLAQCELAERMACSRQYLWLLFNAKLNLSLYSIARIANALGVTPVVSLH
jgi:transcriptional regulator with XRE-family HTH domain